MGDVGRHLVGEIVSSGMDWITATVRSGSGRKAAEDTGDRLIALEECAGHLLDYGRNRNYDLLTCGGVTIGQRAEDCMLQLRSDFARDHWREAARIATNISRLDLQTTVRLDHVDEEFVYDHYREARRHNLQLERSRRLRGQLEDDQYVVMWVGSPRSDVLMRVYDKHKESGDEGYRQCFRYEVQLRNERALAVGRVMLAEPHESAAVAATVDDRMKRAGIAVRYVTDGVPRWPPRPRKETSDDKRLRYLRDQIYGIVRGLEERGRGEDAYAALGVPWPLVDDVLLRREQLRKRLPPSAGEEPEDVAGA
jgi:DNA relaxase NicK